jgi:hypothetical protein
LTLPPTALERNFPDLPSNLNINQLITAKNNLLAKLNTKYRGNTKAKIAKLNRLIAAFKNGSIPTELNSRENFYATHLVKVDLTANKAIAEAQP